MTRRAFVTGASGFLGKFLCPALREAGYQVDAPTRSEADLMRHGSLLPWGERKYERIYHLAAWTQAGDFCLHHPGEQWLINQRINTNVLEFWSGFQPQAKLVSMGTSCSYDPGMELVEENYLAGTPIDSLFTYAMTKRMLHVGQMALSKQYGLKFLTVVPSTLYGPGYHEDGRQMHFIFDLIRKILRGKHLGDDVVLWGDGRQRREIVSAEDFVRGLLLLDGVAENEVINLGAGEDHSIREFAEAICAEAGFDPGTIRYDTTRYVGAKAKFLRTEKFDRLIENFPRKPLREGLAGTIHWFEEGARYR